MALLALGCRDNSDAPPPAPRAATASPAAVEPKPKVPARHRSELVAASPERGLSEYYYSGQLRETLSETPSIHPVLSADDSRVLFLATSDRSLRSYAFATGIESTLVTIPDIKEAPGGERCQRDEPPPLETQVPGARGLRLSADESTACIELREQCGAHEVTARLVVNLGARTAAFASGSDADPCTAPASEGAPTPGPYVVSRGHLYEVHATGERTALLQVGDPAGARELFSPSGKWQLFSDLIGASEHGHRSLFMLDTHNGSIYSLAPGPWRPAIAPGNLLHLRDVETLSVVGSSALGWLPGHDILTVDTIAVFPGEHIDDLGYVTALAHPKPENIE